MTNYTCDQCGIHQSTGGHAVCYGCLQKEVRALHAELKAYKEGIPIEEHHKDGTEYWVGEKGDPWGSYFWCVHPNHWGEIGWQEECHRAAGYISQHPAKPTHIFYPSPDRKRG